MNRQLNSRSGSVMMQHGKTLSLVLLLLGRPIYLSADLGFTAILSVFYLLCFRPLPEALAERNSTKTGHMLGSKCGLKMHDRNESLEL